MYFAVMAGPCPGHPRSPAKKDVDARDERGHDVERSA
jgi:A/G-specific adenine glycosylase